MSSIECVLALDLGTSGCKAALVDGEGAARAWAFQAVETTFPGAGGAEQQPDDWWRAIRETSRRVIEEGRAQGLQAVAVCANTQGEGTVAVDRAGQPLGPAILWMDTRGAPFVRRRLGGALNVSGYAPHHLARMIWQTGGVPSLTGKDPVGHILFLRHERPDVFARAHKFLNVLDYVNLRLSGRMVATVDSLLTTWVTDNRDPRRVRVDDGLCALLGIPRATVPEPVACTDVLGPVDATFAAEVGLAPGTPVVAGAIDVTAAAVGSGAVADGDVHLYLGTSSWLGAHVPKKKTDLLSAIASVPCALPDRYLMIALQATACGNLDFLVDRILFDEDALLPARRPDEVYARLDRLVAEAPAGARGLIYTPWIFGERAPVEDRTIRAGLHNLSLEHSRRDVVRAVYEGVALNTRWVLGPVERFLGHPAAAITAVGGGARSDAWCQILADVLDRPVRQTRRPIEANVRGSAFLAFVALKRLTFADVPRRVPIERTYAPTPAHRKVYDLHFAELKRLYHAHKGIHARLAAFHHRG